MSKRQVGDGVVDGRYGLCVYAANGAAVTTEVVRGLVVVIDVVTMNALSDYLGDAALCDD